MAKQRKEDPMTHLDIIRAWKDEEYRLSLNEAELALLPAHPAGLIGLTDAQLDHVGGGSGVWESFLEIVDEGRKWASRATFVYGVGYVLYRVGKAGLDGMQSNPDGADVALRVVN
jgi:mersacidin/lichenicidin family type 2 lantibiotic